MINPDTTRRTMRSLPAGALAACAVLMGGACKRVPEYVIQPEEMAVLMADVRMADAVLTAQSRAYADPAKKLALKQAVLERNGVTQEQFDTSLMWYGHNIGKYQEVTDRSIEILEERLKEANVRAAGEAAMTVAGDSVDIWNGPAVFSLSRRSPSEYISFSYDSDQNWEQGDIYTLRSRFVVPPAEASWNMTAEYDDGAIDIIQGSMSVTEPRKQEIILVTDSTRRAVRIGGWMHVSPEGNRPVIMDSVSLVRRRTDPVSAQLRRNSQRQILPPKSKNNASDTTTRR